MTNDETFIREFDQAFTSGNLTWIAEHVVEDIEWTVIGEPALKGKQALLDGISQMMAQPLEEHQLLRVVANQQWAVVEGTMEMEVEQGIRHAFSVCDLYDLEDGKVKALTTYVVDRGEVK
ncbi:nuclear transport factor 2 family protein [Alkalihalobacillus oceani]|uniref:Nuclear transport factor 2 family protein n=1 Tax=Halalkalibacter oceani TaxID=1653776 RepID=A0A9X2DR22_9BACI|nr:nuclear transport factor 2 family protein [Halalkalibacter oceani]MCM3715111.1 nuclear transport factor 2 family protein [Halalkalibacter oceani]